MSVSAQAVRELRQKSGAGMMDCKRALLDAQGDLARAGELLRERGLARAVKRAGRETGEGAVAMALDGAQAALVELGCETDFVAKTDDFQALASWLAQLACAHPEAREPDALLALAADDGAKASERVATAAGKLGENIVLKRHARVAVPGAGVVSGYIHAGGKLGVLVALSSSADVEELRALGRDLAMHVAAADPQPLAVDRDGVAKEVLEREAALFRRQAEQEGKPATVIERIVEGRVRKFYAEVCLLEQAFVKDSERSVQQVLGAAAETLGAPVAVSAFLRYRLGE